MEPGKSDRDCVSGRLAGTRKGNIDCRILKIFKTFPSHEKQFSGEIASWRKHFDVSKIRKNAADKPLNPRLRTGLAAPPKSTLAVIQ